MKSHYTYYITDKLTKRMYIGSRSCEGDPYEDTTYMGSSHNQEYNEALKLRPFDFSKDIINIHAVRKDAVDEEIWLHQTFDVGRNPMFYNLSKQTSTGFDRGGTEPWNKGIPRTADTKALISKSLTGRKIQQEVLYKWKERSHTEESKVKISESQRGKYNVRYRHDITLELILPYKNLGLGNKKIAKLLGCNEVVITNRLKGK